MMKSDRERFAVVAIVATILWCWSGFARSEPLPRAAAEKLERRVAALNQQVAKLEGKLTTLTRSLPNIERLVAVISLYDGLQILPSGTYQGVLPIDLPNNSSGGLIGVGSAPGVLYGHPTLVGAMSRLKLSKENPLGVLSHGTRKHMSKFSILGYLDGDKPAGTGIMFRRIFWWDEEQKKKKDADVVTFEDKHFGLGNGRNGVHDVHFERLKVAIQFGEDWRHTNTDTTEIDGCSFVDCETGVLMQSHMAMGIIVSNFGQTSLSNKNASLVRCGSGGVVWVDKGTIAGGKLLTIEPGKPFKDALGNWEVDEHGRKRLSWRPGRNNGSFSFSNIKIDAQRANESMLLDMRRPAGITVKMSFVHMGHVPKYTGTLVRAIGPCRIIIEDGVQLPPKSIVCRADSAGNKPVIYLNRIAVNTLDPGDADMVAGDATIVRTNCTTMLNKLVPRRYGVLRSGQLDWGW